MSYRYYLSYDSEDYYHEIYPITPCELTRKLDMGSDSRYAFRYYWSKIKIGKRLNSAIYDELLSYFIDSTKYSLEIFIKKYRGDETGTLISKSSFSIMDIEIDYEGTTIEVTPKTKDDYTDFDNLNNTKQKVYKNEVTPDDVHLGTPLTLGNWVNIDFDTWSASGQTITQAKDTSTIASRTCELTITGVVDAGETVRVLISNFTHLGTHPEISLSVSSDVFELSASGYFDFYSLSGGTNPVLTITSTPDLSTVQFGLTLTNAVITYRYAGSNDWNGMGLKSYLDNFIHSKLGLIYDSTKIKSTFLFNDALPTGCITSLATYMSSNPTHNYVTEDVNELNNLFLIYRESFAGSIPEILFEEFSFIELMTNLNYFLNCHWFIDADGNFRIEHLNYFEQQFEAALDITAAGYVKFAPESGLKKYSIDKSRLVSREEWVMTLTQLEDFVGLPIIYNRFETTEIINKHSPSLISTDMLNLHNTAEYGINGMLLIACDLVGSDLDMNNDIGVLTAVRVENGRMAIANLHTKYWLNGRCAITGTMNGSAKTFNSSIAYIQSVVKFAITTDINDYGYIHTTFGDGQILEYTRNDNDFITAKLLFKTF